MHVETYKQKQLVKNVDVCETNTRPQNDDTESFRALPALAATYWWYGMDTRFAPSVFDRVLVQAVIACYGLRALKWIA